MRARIERGRGSSRTGRAFTLVEAVLSLAVAGVLMGGMVSAVVLAARALEGGAPAQARTGEAGEALARMSADVRAATGVGEWSASALSLTVPDRTGDGVDDAVRYAWSGTPGDPLTRAVNGGTPATLLADVRTLSLRYLTIQAAPLVQSGELEFVRHNNADVSGTGASGSLREFSVTTSNWCGVFVRPRLGADVVSWGITRVRFVARRDGATNGSLRLKIVRAGSDRMPTGPVLAQRTIGELSFGTNYRWEDLAIGPVTGLVPGDGVCFLVEGASGSATLLRVQYDRDGASMTANTHFATSGNGGGSWSAPTDRDDAPFALVGTVTTRQVCP